MIKVDDFFKTLRNKNINFFAGVPDSLLKDICAYISDNTIDTQNVITSNEGAAVALGVGYNLATNHIPLIYLQNSGLGNTVNPLLSLADAEVYSIPLLLMIGWRGEPGIKDEPQHIKQGRITTSLLDVMEIPYRILDSKSDYEKVINDLVEIATNQSKPVALLVRKGTFAPYKLESMFNIDSEISREDALECVINSLPKNSIVVSTTGMLSRELFELREKYNQSHQNDFLTVGSMGHTLQIALGIALARPNSNVFCLDGDGSALMHLGSYAICGNLSPMNLKVVIFNNSAHDSVGGQPTIGVNFSFENFAKVANWDSCGTINRLEEISSKIDYMVHSSKASLLEIRIKKGARKDLGRPTNTPLQNKQLIKGFISSQ